MNYVHFLLDYKQKLLKSLIGGLFGLKKTKWKMVRRFFYPDYYDSIQSLYFWHNFFAVSKRFFCMYNIISKGQILLWLSNNVELLNMHLKVLNLKIANIYCTFWAWILPVCFLRWRGYEVFDLTRNVSPKNR